MSYPPGHKPSWWLCPGCGATFHDSAQRGQSVAWDLPAECGPCRCEMIRATPWRWVVWVAKALLERGKS